MTTLTIGYGRVSTDEQSTAVQEEQLKAAGCSVVLAENASGTRMDGREKLELALNMLKAHPGSTLVVCRLDRLARNVRDAIDILEKLNTYRCGLRILDLGIDTSTPHGKMIFAVLSAMAQWETEIRRERQKLGIEKAKKEGTAYLGRQGRLTPAEAAELRQKHGEGVSISALGRFYDISESTVCRHLRTAAYGMANRAKHQARADSKSA